MGKMRQKSRRQASAATTLLDKRPRHEPHWQAPGRAAPPARAMPLPRRAEPQVIAAPPPLHRHEPSPEDLIPIPRSRALAVPRTGLVHQYFDQFTRWLWTKLPKKARTPTDQRREVQLTAKKLKELRRQISVMEKTLGRMS